MKYTLNLPTILKPSKTLLLIVGSVLVVAGVIAFGIVRSVQADRADAVAAARIEEQKKNDAQATTNKIAALEATIKAERAESAQICSWVKGVAPKYRITVPPLCVNR